MIEARARKIGVGLGLVIGLAMVGLTIPVSSFAKGVLRVCADPADLPFSNRAKEGLENRIAEVVASALDWDLQYYWWPHQRGLVRKTLQARHCDVLIGVPSDYDPVLTTRPYYRSTYVLAYRSDRGITIRSLQDPVLSQWKIGVHWDTPGHVLLAERGLTRHLVPYSLIYDPVFHPENYPGRIMEDLLSDKIDAAVVWGPIAGYFAKKKGAPVAIFPLDREPCRVPLSFNISMGVRKGDFVLKEKLESVLTAKSQEIRKILEEYGVPILEPLPQKPKREKHPHGPVHSHSHTADQAWVRPTAVMVSNNAGAGVGPGSNTPRGFVC
ncbi:substrate-binding domain-containing protein [Candidatus Methylacidithermus pantelleriae]|uniref:Putative periplasmic binding protein n=1 Tax=Candidatus Methylacidithermus pantelleriae TaxID=2744239 RepID=A0A8J2BKN0_9BACT|nr:substrate-binding domain-containing protein [Candidatus Methylacidithermus pantelleriae]CAF0689831.1 putative periplasmic binding protein [Candidatus Methylacidithermus pantelleriae]